MSTLPLPLPALVLLGLCALSGVVLLARFASAAPGEAASVVQRGAPGTLAVLAAALAGAWLGPLAFTFVLAALSAWMLQRMLALDVPRSPRDVIPRLACHACVPLQYGLLLAGDVDGVVVVVPLVATLALPLAAVLAGDTRGLGERSATRCVAVLLCVYALSFAAAIAWLDAGGMRGVATAIGVVTAALGGSAAFERFLAATTRRRRAPLIAMLTGMALVAALGAAAGGAFALLLALPPAAAATTWGASAALGALGTRVAGAMARARAGPPRAGLPGRLEALAFAAPLVYFALR